MSFRQLADEWTHPGTFRAASRLAINGVIVSRDCWVFARGTLANHDDEGEGDDEGGRRFAGCGPACQYVGFVNNGEVCSCPPRKASSALIGSLVRLPGSAHRRRGQQSG